MKRNRYTFQSINIATWTCTCGRQSRHSDVEHKTRRYARLHEKRYGHEGQTTIHRTKRSDHSLPVPFPVSPPSPPSHPIPPGNVSVSSDWSPHEPSLSKETIDNAIKALQEDHL
ncbi:MAG: hypothetical protein KAV87_19505 [Desulfobacteraceae bacterium]|nr:hypothetical protein [Desulfobacteraceae bacterium]